MTTSTTPSDASARSHLVRSNVIVATGTALSRLTGMARVIVFGIVVGQTALADAYDGANNSPNSVYELILGGVLSATLVPLFTHLLVDDDEDAIEAVVSTAIVVLTAVTAVSIVAAPLIFRLFALNPSADVDADQYRSVGTVLARVFLLQIFFYGLTALAGAMLNARRRFFAAAWAPVLSNVVIIATLLAIPSIMRGEQPGLDDVLDTPALKWTLAIGATAGIATMGLVLVPALHHAGFRLRFRPDFSHPAVHRLFRLSGWTFGYVVANQVALIVVKNLAKPGSGGQDAYTKAFTFFQLPHGLLAMSIATTFVPELARAVAARNRPAFVERMGLGMRLVALLTFPASALFVVLARPTIGALLEHGQFSATAADTTARTLAGFAPGLVGFSLYLFALRGFYAHQDTRTPFVVNVVENLLNIVLAFALVGRYGVMGLGLAFAIAYLVAAVWAMQVLARKVRQFPLRPIFASFGRMLLAAVLMAEIVWILTRHVGSDTGWGAVARVSVGGLAGLGLYGALLLALRAPELDQLRSRLVRRAAT